ncbi:MULTISPECIES: hypothetical protein [unclassified Pedobacter]|nr:MULTISPECIES: hypothetical protein [unclassified Pedobacter]
MEETTYEEYLEALRIVLTYRNEMLPLKHEPVNEPANDGEKILIS